MTTRTRAVGSPDATRAVDWEQRIDFPRLRPERLTRAKAALEASDLGAVLLFDPNNIRYVTSTHIGEWARDKNASFALLMLGAGLLAKSDHGHHDGTPGIAAKVSASAVVEPAGVPR